MKVIRRTPLRVIKLTANRQPKFVHRFDQPEAVEMSVGQKVAFREMLIERVLKPVLKGKIDIHELITPPGGWAQLEARHPSFSSLSVGEQLKIVFN